MQRNNMLVTSNDSQLRDSEHGFKQSTNQNEYVKKNSTNYASFCNDYPQAQMTNKKSTNRNSYECSLYSVSSGKYNEEYSRQQENDRILKRIINPKRDKVILRSVEFVKKNQQSGSLTNSRGTTGNKKRSNGSNSRQQWSNWINPKSILDRWRFNDGQQELRRKQENERMGQRILNVKSIYRNLATPNALNKSRTKGDEKINRGVRAFFQEHQKPLPEQGSSKSIHPNILFPLKPFYGCGPTLISFKNIQLRLLPEPKQTDLFMLELQVKNCKAKNYRTGFIPYKALLHVEIKFAVRLRKIGEFVPLRIWKANGVNNLEIGIVDVLFGKYLDLLEGGHADQCDVEDYQENQENIHKLKEEAHIVRENKDSRDKRGMIENKWVESKDGKTRVVLEDRLESRLRRSKRDEIAGSIKFNYTIYQKRYH